MTSWVTNLACAFGSSTAPRLRPTRSFSQRDEGFLSPRLITSRARGVSERGERTRWDLIVVDEAHKLSAYEYGTKVDERKRYRAVKKLALKTDHLLFLTATPHRGRKDTFRRLPPAPRRGPVPEGRARYRTRARSGG